MSTLDGLPIAITGASSGIGLATALACAQAGMPVALAARRADRLDEAVDRIRKTGGRAIAVPCDVTDPAQCESLVDRTIAEFGSIYSVFANAGYGLEKPFEEMTDRDFRDLFETNYYGTIHTIRPALRAVRAAGPRGPRGGRGHLLLCSSCLSKIGVPYYAAYCTTKAGQDHLARALRHELRGAGVHVSSVHPIGTRTELYETKTRLGGPSRLLPKQEDRRLQAPEVVARAVVRCLRSPRGEVWTSIPMRLALGFSVAMPGLTDFVLAGMMNKRLARRRED